MNDTFLIKKSMITEKALSFTGLRKYVFMVQPGATKPEIRKAIEKLYGVHVTHVNVVNRPPKAKRFRARWSMKGGYKKALVTLRKGETIDIAK